MSQEGRSILPSLNGKIRFEQGKNRLVFGDINGEGFIQGELPNGLFGTLYYLNGIPHIIITASTGMVVAEPGTSVLTLV